MLVIAFFALAGNACNGVNTHKPRAILIQPFADFPPSQAAEIFSEIKAIDSSVRLNTAIPLPATAFYSPRNRYRADSLIRFLKEYGSDDTIVIGLTTKDISATRNGIADWGIMGLGYRPGNACIISTFRLSKNYQSQQSYKLALHELGHTQGLPHCPHKTCFMRDAAGGNPLNEETGFCASCKSYLQQKGWILK